VADREPPITEFEVRTPNPESRIPSPEPRIPTPEPALAIEWLRRPGELAAVADAWRDLERAAGHRSHVSTFDFLEPWYRHYAGEYGGSPLVGLAWRGARLAGVAPLTIRRGRVGRIPVTRVDFAPNDSIAGEFLVEDDRPDTIGALVESLLETVRLDVICLNGFEPSSAALAALGEAARRRRLAMETEGHAFAVVNLREGYGAYRSRLSGHYRRNLNQKARKIEAEGAVVGGVELTSGLATIDESIARMIAITEASYKLQGQRLADCHRHFLADVARRFGARGMLSLPILSIGGRDAAFILGVVERGCWYDITLAYDEAFEKVSPGGFLMQRTLERLAAAGVHTVVSHGAHDYKKHWASGFVPQTRVFLFAPSPRAMATRAIRFGLQPLWQRLRG
jgi:CelD/BcsL family acetyltransferase involved in cellulose biosynthesis